MADLETQQPDNGPAQIQTPAQYPTATRIEDGIAYDVKGNKLGPVSDQPAAQSKPVDDQWGVVATTPAQNQTQDPWAVASTSPSQAVNTGPATGISPAKPGILERIQRTILPGFSLKGGTAATTFFDPSEAMTPLEQEQHPILTGTGQFIGGLASPETVTLIAATAGLGEAGAVGRVVAKLLAAGFTAQQVYQASKQAPEIVDAINRGDESEALRLTTHTVLNLAAAAYGGQHAVGAEAKASTGVGKSFDTAIDVGKSRVQNILRSDADALAAKTKIYESTQRVFDQRMHEVEVATKQAEMATQKANMERVNEAQGTGSRELTVQAENEASDAAANAKKAQAALAEAGEQRAAAQIERDRLQRKAVKTVSKVPEKQMQEVAGAKEDFKKSIPPSNSGPAAYTDRDYEIARGYLEHHHQNVESVSSNQDVYDALDYTQKDMENKVKPYVVKYADEPNPRNIKMDVRDSLGENPRTDFVDKGMKELEPYNLTDPSIVESDSIRAQLNAENRAILQKNSWDIATALQVDPAFAARYYAAESLRNGEYDLFEAKNVKGIRELRQDEASIIRVRNAAQKSIVKGDVAVRGSGESGPLRKAAAWTAKRLATTGGAAAGAAIGGPFGAAAGAAGVENGLNPRIGRLIAPGDLTRNELIERSMKVRGGGVPITEIQGTGTPASRPSFSVPPKPGTQMSPQDIMQISRENSPLHTELATHYGVFHGDESYGDLEQRFKEDVADKQFHGIPLENSEKKLLGMLNQQNAADVLSAQEAAQQQALSGKQLGKFNLPDEVEPLLNPNKRIPNGMTTAEGIVHDLAHVVVGNERGVSFPDGVRSHLHPENSGTGRIMSAPIDFSEFMDEEGNVDFNKMKNRIADLATTYVAGGVANDLYHDVPFTENHGLGADMTVLKRFMKKVGFSDAEASKMIAQAADDAATILSRPGMREILEGHAAVRESGLDQKYHFSPERVEQLLQDLKEGTERETTTGKSSGTDGERNQSASGTGAGTEGQAKAGNAKGVREKSAAGSEGQERSVGKSNESTSTTGKASATESNNPAVSDIAQGGHAGATVVSEEELARPGRFVKISRSGIPTDQGKTPDFNLAAGEAGYQVRPDGSFELKAGQETPLTKRGVQGYAREVFGNKNPALSESPKDVIENEGLKYKGELVPGSGVHMFEHPDHPGMTASLKEPITPEKLQTKMQSKFDEFGIKNPNPALSQNEIKTTVSGRNLRVVVPDELSAQQLEDLQKQIAEHTEKEPFGAVFLETPDAKNYEGEGPRPFTSMTHPGPKDIEMMLRQIQVKTPDVESYTKPMRIPASITSTFPDSFIHHHELAHGVIGGLEGYKNEGVISHRHPIAKRNRLTAAVVYRDRPGPLSETIDGLLKTTMAGAAANEAYDGVPRDKNVGLSGDLRRAKSLLNALGVPQDQWQNVIDGAIDKAKEVLTNPQIESMIRQAAKTREDNLPVTLHHSENKVNSLVERAKRILNGEPGYEFGTTGQGDQGSGADVAGTEATGAGKDRTPNPEQKLRAFKPPKNTYQVVMKDAAGNEETKSFTAGSRRALFKQLMQDPNVRAVQIVSETVPEVGEPFQVGNPALSTEPNHIEKAAQNLYPKSDETDERSYIEPNGQFRSVMDNDHFGVGDLYPEEDDLHDEDAINQFMDDTGWLRTGKYEDSFLIHGGQTAPTNNQISQAIKQIKYWSPEITDKIMVETPFGSKDFPEFTKPGEIQRELEKLYSISNRPEESVAPTDRVSTRLPKGKDATENPIEGTPLTIGKDSLQNIPDKLRDKFAETVRNYPGVKIPDTIKDPNKVMDRFINHISDNLKFLYDQVEPEKQTSNAKWYESANKLASDLANKHGITKPQSAAVIATQSPQKDWDMNVGLARRIVDIYKNQRDTVATPEMIQKGLDIVNNTGANKDLAKVLPNIENKKLSELTDPYDRAAWVRLYDEAHNPREFHSIDPGTGESRGLRTNANGSPSKIAWGSLGQIDNALSVLDNGTRENISERLGEMHKVRNFYNNIIDPTNDQDVTIDTHAVAAGLMQPLGGNATEVLHNFGAAGKNAGTGVKGTYPLYAEAYRKAAGELGILPRELQSVVWEHIRQMFPTDWKSPENEKLVKNIWKKYSNGKQSLNQTRQQILSISEQAQKQVNDARQQALEKAQRKLDKTNKTGYNAGVDALRGEQ